MHVADITTETEKLFWQIGTPVVSYTPLLPSDHFHSPWGHSLARATIDCPPEGVCEKV